METINDSKTDVSGAGIHKETGHSFFGLGQGSAAGKKAGVVILDKATYFETQARFPFLSVQDIQKAVQTDMGAYCPFATDLFFVRKIQTKDGKTDVNLWFVKTDAAAAAKQVSPLLIMPESLLCAYYQEKGLRSTLLTNPAPRCFMSI